MIDPRRLEILRVFSVAGTMAAAAETLFISTSAVSQQLRILEQEVGVALLDRRGRRATLTDAGAVLTQFAAEMAALSETAASTMQRLAGTFQGVVRVSAPPSFASTVLPTALMEMHHTYPTLRVSVTDLEPFEGIRGLRDGSVDLAVIDDIQQYDLTEIDTVPVGVDELLLCAPPTMPLGAGPIEVSSLSDARWVLDGSQEVFDEFLFDLCRRAGFEPDIVARCRNVAVTLALVDKGVGVALLSSMHTRGKSLPVQTRRFSPAQTRNILLARRRSSQPSHLVDAVEAILRTRGAGFLRSAE